MASGFSTVIPVSISVVCWTTATVNTPTIPLAINSHATGRQRRDGRCPSGNSRNVATHEHSTNGIMRFPSSATIGAAGSPGRFDVARDAYSELRIDKPIVVEVSWKSGPTGFPGAREVRSAPTIAIPRIPTANMITAGMSADEVVVSPAVRTIAPSRAETVRTATAREVTFRARALTAPPPPPPAPGPG